MELLLNQKSELKKIRLENLKPSPLNSYDMQYVEELAWNIRACGLLTPLTVAGPGTDGKYEILSGERRYRALNILHEEDPEGGFDDVPCHIIADSTLNDIKKELALEFSNTEGRDNSDREQHRYRVMQLLKKLVDANEFEEGEIASVLAKLMKTSKRYGRMYAAIFRDGTESLQKAVMSTSKKPNSDGDPVHIPTSVASRVSQLPKEKQEEVVSRVNAGEKPTEVLASIKRKEPPVIVEQSTSTESIPEPDFELDEINAVDDANEPALVDDDIDDLVSKPKNTEIDLSAIDNMDGDDAMEALLRLHQGDHVDLNLSTSGLLRNEEKQDSNGIHSVIRKWMARINGVLDRGEELDTEDQSLLEEFASLYEKYMG